MTDLVNNYIQYGVLSDLDQNHAICLTVNNMLIRSDSFGPIKTEAILKYLGRSNDYELSHAIIRLSHFNIRVTLSELVFRY